MDIKAVGRKRPKSKEEKEYRKARKKEKMVNDQWGATKVKEASKETQMDGEESANKCLSNLKEERKKEKNKKERNNNEGVDGSSSLIEIVKDKKMREIIQEQTCNESCGETRNGGEDGAPKNKKSKRRKVDTDSRQVAEDGNHLASTEMNNEDEVEKNKKRKRKRKREKVDGVIAENIKIDEMGQEKSKGRIMENGELAQSGTKRQKKYREIYCGTRPEGTVVEKSSIVRDQIQDDKPAEEGNTTSVGSKVKRRKSHKHHIMDDSNKEKKKKATIGQFSDGNYGIETPITKKVLGMIDTFDPSTSGGTSKRVSFCDHIEVFPSSDGENHQEDGILWGKRFSNEEDEIIEAAVYKYIREHDLGDEGLYKILHCKKHPEVKNCWKEIAADLPRRPTRGVYSRAHILFERGEKRKWSNEELEHVRNMYDKHGADFKKMAEELGKHRFHVKDAWRRIKLPNLKKGNWSQEEYQTLFDLVNMDLQLRVFEERKSKHGMLRDNICWEAISERLSTRNNATCCFKWYKQLTSSLVSEKKWADTDDYRLLSALDALDAISIEDVDWDHLLEHRPGDICRKRWHQMVQHIGQHGVKSFAEQVEVLSKRYCPALVEARETFDCKPIVD